MHCRRYIGRLDGKFHGIIFVMSSKCEQQATLECKVMGASSDPN